MQVCNSDRSAAYTLGIVSEVSQNPAEALAAVQEVLATWSNVHYLQEYSGSSMSQISVGEVAEQHSLPTSASSPHGHGHGHHRFHGKIMHAGIYHRDMCKAIQVEDGNSCGTLATRCGITPAEFTKYNPDKKPVLIPTCQPTCMLLCRYAS